MKKKTVLIGLLVILAALAISAFTIVSLRMAAKPAEELVRAGPYPAAVAYPELVAPLRAGPYPAHLTGETELIPVTGGAVQYTEGYQLPVGGILYEGHFLEGYQITTRADSTAFLYLEGHQLPASGILFEGESLAGIQGTTLASGVAFLYPEGHQLPANGIRLEGVSLEGTQLSSMTSGTGFLYLEGRPFTASSSIAVPQGTTVAAIPLFLEGHQMSAGVTLSGSSSLAGYQGSTLAAVSAFHYTEGYQLPVGGILWKGKLLKGYQIIR